MTVALLGYVTVALLGYVTVALFARTGVHDQDKGGGSAARLRGDALWSTVTTRRVQTRRVTSRWRSWTPRWNGGREFYVKGVDKEGSRLK